MIAPGDLGEHELKAASPRTALAAVGHAITMGTVSLLTAYPVHTPIFVAGPPSGLAGGSTSVLGGRNQDNLPRAAIHPARWYEYGCDLSAAST